ncbi:MAG: YceI family protein [Cyclobacteriaceae bacterium]|nr:YceI family protein [Cyclobacteriaceae bacterium]
MRNMNQKLALLLFVLAITASLQAQVPYTLKTPKLSVSGTSTLHEWTSEATKVEWSGSLLVQDKKIIQVKDVQVKIPVTSIKSEKGKTMDNKTYEAFNSDKNPNIVYKLTIIKITGNGPDFTLDATGTLSMAGATQTFDMPVKAKLLANGDIQLIGSKKINMKDYKMVPPTAMMGTIKVGEEVTVNFDLTITPTK